MIKRIWHGWTSFQNADSYETLLKHEIFLNIENRMLVGFKGIELLRRDLAEETEFVTIMTFENFEAVKKFAGEDYSTAVVPLNAQQLLLRFDRTSQHYEIIS